MRRYDTAELATAVFAASELVFFGFLIAAYIYYQGSIGQGPTARDSLHPPRTLIFTVCLLASSLTLWIAERRLAAGRPRGFRLWLAITIALGAIFIAGQGAEYADLIQHRVTPARNLFGATFFTLTGFHGLHVFCGLLALAILLVLAFRRNLGPRAVSGVGAVSIYWHFVDGVWIVIFSLIYMTVWI